MSKVAAGSRYAQAFLSLISSPSEGEILVRTIEGAAHAYTVSGELRSALSNPVVPLREREAIVSQISNTLGGTDLARRCLLVMLRRGRISALPDAARSLRRLVDQSQGVLRGEVLTAKPMPESFYADLERNLSTRHGRKVVLERRIDEGLVGGVITHVDGQTIDQSIRGNLSRIERDLLDSVGKTFATGSSAPN